LSPEQHAELEAVYRKTKDPRVRTRAQMVLLSAEQGLAAVDIAPIVREDRSTVWRWLKRYLAEGVEGLKDDPRAVSATGVKVPKASG
jgi:transposase